MILLKKFSHIAKTQARIYRFKLDQHIEQHPIGGVSVDMQLLHARLGIVVRVEAVDVECRHDTLTSKSSWNDCACIAKRRGATDQAQHFVGRRNRQVVGREAWPWGDVSGHFSR